MGFKRINKSNGFVLVFVLWTLLAIVIAVSFFSVWVENLTNAVISEKNNTQNKIDLYCTKSVILYLLTTQKFTYAGLTTPIIAKENELDNLSEQNIEQAFGKLFLDDVTVIPIGNELKLDDTIYEGCGNINFSIQDENGLINLNFISEPVIGRLLGLLGIPIEERLPLFSKLYDYIDLDNFHLINGAEKQHYIEEKLPPPRNRFLITPSEAKRVIDWGSKGSLWDDMTWQQSTTVAPVTTPNFNTAPSLVLQSFYRLTSESAQQIIYTRQNQSFQSLSQLNSLTGVIVPSIGIEEMDMNFFPSSYLRITFIKKTSMERLHIQLTPYFDNKKPFEEFFFAKLPKLPSYQVNVKAINTNIPFFSN